MKAACCPLIVLGFVVGALAPARSVSVGCSISTTGVNFGGYNVYESSALDSTGSVTYNCGSPIVFTIDLSQGSSLTFTPRRMTNGAEALSYNLYLDPARNTIWGDGTSGTSHYSVVAPPLNTNVTVTLYGRVPALQDVSAGSYGDTVNVVINF